MVLAFWLIFVFVTGASVGSFLNVAIARLPYEKSLLWPNSRCGSCHQAIAWYDNLPIVSYLWLGGRCRTCSLGYSPVYMLVEIGAALAFVGLFWLEIVENIHGWPDHQSPRFHLFFFPWASFVGFAWHTTLFCFLLVASVCDLKWREIPLQLTMTGTLVGLVGATLMPWPWPYVGAGIVLPPGEPMIAPGDAFIDIRATIQQGLYAWPFWGPLPSWAGPGDWQTGLATGVVGALVGTFLLRAIGFVFGVGLGKEALGLGDADLMMMVGAFLGWQIVVVAFFLSVAPALIFGIIQLAVNRDNSLPFGPSLAASVVVTWLAWQPIGEFVRPILFWAEVLILGAIACGGMMFVMSLALRLIRGKPEVEAK